MFREVFPQHEADGNGADGKKNTILVATLGVIIGGIIPLVAGTSIPALYVGRFIEGLGIALTGVAAPTIITLWFPEKTRGVMLGLWCCWVPLSITLDSLVCPAIAPIYGWQGVFTFVVICALLIHPGKNSEYTKMREAEKQKAAE